MAIAGISNASMDYGKIASGKRINSAADDAAGLSIANKMLKESNGFDVGASNIQDGIGVANIKDGALSTMQESLQRIRELSLKASNGIYGSSEKQMIQDEVDQLLQDIERTAVGTSYNEMKLMDGSKSDINIATIRHGLNLLRRTDERNAISAAIINEKTIADIDNDFFVNQFNSFISFIDATS